MEGLYKITNALSNGTIPTPYAPFPRLGVRNPNPKLQLLLWTSNFATTFAGSIRTKAYQKFWKKGAWAYPGTAQFFCVPPIISGTGIATNLTFCTHIHRRIDRIKSPLKIPGKVAVRDSRKFSGHPYIGRISRSFLRQLRFLVLLQ